MSKTMKMVLPKATFSVEMPLSSLFPPEMSDAEHKAHFGYSRIDEIIEEGVQQRLSQRASRPSPTELTETEIAVAKQLGIPLADLRRQKEKDAKVSLSRSGDQGREQAIADLHKNFPGRSREQYLRMIEAGREE